MRCWTICPTVPVLGQPTGNNLSGPRNESDGRRRIVGIVGKRAVQSGMRRVGL